MDFSEHGPLTDHGVYQTISTGRVQFFPIERNRSRFDVGVGTPLRLADISPIVFSEVMRDVDLLVGVTSIGADPTWGAERDAPHAEYWHRFADGELSTAAENRKTILETLLPKLAIMGLKSSPKNG